MNILIVGAGAVGLVYGQHLSMAGHRVTFFVKEQHRNDLKSGVSMIRKRRLVKDEVRHFSDFSLLSQWNHVAGEEWDYVFLAISSDALRALPFGIVKDAIADATLLMLQPSETDYKVLGEYWSEENVVKGMINMISYYHPLPGETPLQTGEAIRVAYYLPPTAMPLSGGARAMGVEALLRESAIACKRVDDAVSASRLPNAILMTFLCALEDSDWNFAQLRRDRQLLAQLVTAQKALLTCLAKQEERPQQRAMRWTSKGLSRFLYQAGLMVAPLAMPFSLQAYFRAHFMKVRTQTQLYMEDYCHQCDDEALTGLYDRVFAVSS
ncbi:2-dehydropantoate 2-reductase N-terminal domain-containing protein [Alcanivorax sp.]|jgi:2-dehydropantoate 2-reductase|uniref:ketopantoate reductase family protein n=1 Tax=Alcanivorax sp. TaxID=1872427 RepID=UPI0025BE1E8C|nr:2-dehydropantoate 2-reductase N-terminal domain-containing protein [Alcanivorax sp.]